MLQIHTAPNLPTDFPLDSIQSAGATLLQHLQVSTLGGALNGKPLHQLRIHIDSDQPSHVPYSLRPAGLRVILRSHRNATRWAVFTDSALPDSRLAACAAEWRTATPALLDALDEELQRLHLLAIEIGRAHV